MSRSTRCFSAAMVGLTLLATLLVTAPPGAASRSVSQAYTVPSNGVLKLTGSRLRPRPRDVAVRRTRGCAAGPHPPADPSLLLPGHDALPPRRHDAGADHGRHRQRRPRRAGQRPAGPEDGRQPVVPPADSGQDHDVAAAHSRRQHRPRLLQRQLAHLQAQRQDTERCLRVRPPRPRHTARRRHHPRLPRRAAAGRPEHDQRAALGPVREGRHPARDADLLGARGRACAGRRGAHVRLLRQGRAPHPQLLHLRHHLVPGVRRAGRRGLRAATRPSPRPSTRC